MAEKLDVYRHYSCEDDYADLDMGAACERLAHALACKTVYTTPKDTDFSEFERLQAHLKQSFPRIMAAGTFELVGHSVLITVPGTEPALDAVQLIAHQDVVPVVPGTEDQWEHDAFAGHIDDEWVWGRGALDIKDMLMAELEATEYLLARGEKPRRTIYLAFGEDEEVTSKGATALAAEMARRDMRSAFLVDEGTTTMFDGAAYGAPGAVVSDICLSQKGYLNLRLTARGQGGHSSNPFGGTSLERLCRAVALLAENKPAPTLTPLVAGTFKELAPQISEEPFASLVADVDANAQEIADAAAQVRELYPFVCTTVAVDQVIGSSAAANVMPGDVSAVVNFRLLPGVHAMDVQHEVADLLAGLGIEVTIDHSTPAGRMDTVEGAGYAELKEALEHFHPGVTWVPSFVCGGTDSVRYEDVCGSIMRVCPFRPAPEEEARGVHGVNERISRRTYAQGIRVLIRLLERTAFSELF
ncbi:M20/M25/M40 family metallo-hydrolase [Paratractidigestivibacter sp.]|uniref:M20/M25/M40 family metallo-hydrolase n=1 Tax=Paratractidigestivibacter sp. TaxID=2847316 RepID=UPI002AC9B3B1|nr:M20/M25/M40 family metallo-hydrolase [Paratractidigestivibacter sp.]